MSALLHYASIYTTKRNSWKLRRGKGDNLSAHVGLDTWFHDGDQGNPLREERRAWKRENLIGLGGPITRVRPKKEKEMLLEKKIYLQAQT